MIGRRKECVWVRERERDNNYMSVCVQGSAYMCMYALCMENTVHANCPHALQAVSTQSPPTHPPSLISRPRGKGSGETHIQFWFHAVKSAIV